MKQEVKSLEALLNKTVLTMNGAELLELLHQVKRTEVKEEKKQSSLNDYRDLPQFITGIKGLAKVLGISALSLFSHIDKSMNPNTDNSCKNNSNNDSAYDLNDLRELIKANTRIIDLLSKRIDLLEQRL